MVSNQPLALVLIYLSISVIFYRDFIVRDAVKADTEGIENLVDTLSHRDHLLADLEQYLAARRDQVTLR